MSLNLFNKSVQADHQSNILELSPVFLKFILEAKDWHHWPLRVITILRETLERMLAYSQVLDDYWGIIARSSEDEVVSHDF